MWAGAGGRVTPAAEEERCNLPEIQSEMIITIVEIMTRFPAV